MLALWLILIFVLGAAIGSFLNVCIERLPLEKSILWPASRCGKCFQPIRWYDNVPLLSYWLLRGRCRQCGARFSLQYFAVELITGLGFAGLFWLVIIENVHGFPLLKQQQPSIDAGVIPEDAWVIFAHHALLFCLLLVAAGCDIKYREIPLAVTIPGALLGLGSALLWPWPWPYTTAQAQALLAMRPAFMNPWIWPVPGNPPQGLYPFPFWGPLPEWAQPGGNWQTGLATAFVGLLVGTFMLRGIRCIFSKGLGVEALGLGDADIMMMAGCFLGWQPVVVAFFVAIFPALLLGIVQMVLTGDNAVPFGPSLALGVGLTWLGWTWIAPSVQMVFFHPVLLPILVGLCGVFMLMASLLLRLRRR